MRDSGDLASSINIVVSSYNGVDAVHTVEGLVAGVVYRFTYYATNSFGSSVASKILTIAATNLPNKPENISVDWAKSTKTSFMLSWKAPSVLPEYPIQGYKLEMDDGHGG